jgi:HEAT repeat protein
VREPTATDVESKRAYVMALRRLAKPSLLRVIAQMLPRNRQRADECMAILVRAGEDGAEALIEQLTNAPSLSDRRVYFDSLVKLHSGVPALIHMLGDARWYVARNAADLLGEMQVPEAEVPLADLLRHNDDRVRRAAASALAKLGTPRAMDALHQALQDNAAQVRLQAAIGLSARKGLKSASTLSRALDTETDLEVQLAILAALGRLATADAVQKLIKSAEPDGRLFKKKPVAYRVAAVQALGETRAPAAMNALTALVHDKEKEVREAVVKALTQQPTA